MSSSEFDEYFEDIVVSELLNTSPAKFSHDFILSTLFERRQKVDREGSLKQEWIRHTILPDWLERAGYLGPYERRFLKRIYDSSHNLTIFRSGTGSGKSSILNFVAEYVNSHRVVDRVQSDLMPFDQVLFVLDFQGVTGKYTAEVNGENDQTFHNNVNDFRKILKTKLETEFFTALEKTSVNFNVPFAEKVLENFFEAQNTENLICKSICSTIKLNLGSFEKYGPTENFMRIRSEIEKLENVEEQVYAWLTIWACASQVSKDSHEDFSLVVAIDNIDQIAGYLQDDIAQILQTFFTDQSVVKSGFKIIFMMRLATAVDKANRLPVARILKAHQAPNPVDILTIIITIFLLNPEKLNGFNNLETEEAKANLYGRIYSFFSCLLDSDGHTRTLLHGLSGSNLRHAKLHAAKWILSRNNSNLSIGNEEREKISDQLVSDLTPNAVAKLTRAFGRAIAIEWASLTSHDATVSDPDAPRVWAFLEKLAQQIALVLVHSRMLEPKDAEASSGRRATVSRLVGEEMESQLESGLSHQHEPNRAYMIWHLSDAFEKPSSWSDGNYSSFLIALRHIGHPDLLELVSSQISLNGYQTSSIVESFCKLILEAVEAKLDNSDRPSLPIRLSRPLDRTHIPIEARNLRSSSSRFRNAMIMLENSQGRFDLDLEPVNLFLGSGEENNYALPLYILYRLAEVNAATGSDKSVSFQQIDRDRILFGGAEIDFETTLGVVEYRDSQTL